MNQRWLGGLLTNFLTIQSIKRLKSSMTATAADMKYSQKKSPG